MTPDFTEPEKGSSPSPLARLISAAGILAGGVALGQLAQLAATPVLSRLYSPEAFGILGLYQSFVGFAAVPATLRYEFAILSADNENDAVNLLLLTVACAGVVSMLSGIVYVFCVHYKLFGLESMPMYFFPLIMIGVFSTATFFAVRNTTVRFGNYTLAAKASIAQSTTRATGQLSFAIAGLGFGLILGDLLGRCAGILSQAKETAKHIGRRTGQLNSFKDMARRYSAFPRIGLPAAIVGTAVLMLPTPLIVHYYGARAGGLYTIVLQLLAAPSALIGASTADAFQTTLLEIRDHDVGSRLRLLRQTSGALLGLSIFPAILIITLAPTYLGKLLGEDWTDAGLIAATLTPAMVASLAVAPVSRATAVFDGQHVKLIYDCLSAVALFAVFFISEFQQLSFLDAMRIFVASKLALYAMYYLMLEHLTRSYKTVKS